MLEFILRNIKTLLAIAGFLVGGLIGAEFESMVRSGFDTSLFVVAIFSIVVFLIITNQAEAVDERKSAHKDLIAQTKEVVHTVADSHNKQHVELNELSVMLTDGMASLAAQFGLRVERLLTSEVNSFKSISQDGSAQKIISARKRLHILDTISEEGRWPDEAMNQDILSMALDQMIILAGKSPAPFSYRRIIQVPDLGQSLHRVYSPVLIRHCHEILSARDKIGPSRIALKIARRRFPFKFVLIDDECVIIQLQEYADSGGAFKLWGELRIIDPSQNLISIFDSIWTEVWESQDARSVGIDDLPPVPAVRTRSRKSSSSRTSAG